MDPFSDGLAIQFSFFAERYTLQIGVGAIESMMFIGDSEQQRASNPVSQPVFVAYFAGRMSESDESLEEDWHDFKGLMDEEDRIVQQRVQQDYCYAYVTYKEPGRFDAWIESAPSESLLVRLELLATEAGMALGCPPGILPRTHWFRSLVLDLRANNSNLLRAYSENECFIDHILEASTNYCARLGRQALEKAAMNYEAEAIPPEEVETDREETVADRSQRRTSWVKPMLRVRRWTRGKWATKAGVSKNSVYEYLYGKRDLGIENRQAMADALGVKPEDLPD